MGKFKIIISASPEALRQEIHTLENEGWVSVTVEAEYGDVCVTGSAHTLAHHGSRADQPCPCLGGNLFANQPDKLVVGVSHFDLDTLGGVMRALGVADWDNDVFCDMFWHIAAAVDLRGVHRLKEIRNDLEKSLLEGFSMGDDDYDSMYWAIDDTWKSEIDCLNAFYAWSQSNRCFPPRDGSVADVTEFFKDAIDVLERIFDDDQELLESGRRWKREQDDLDSLSFARGFSHEILGGLVVLRVSDKFVNHLYNSDAGLYRSVVAFNHETGSITVSVSDPIRDFHAGEFCKEHLGELAGGKDVIGGGDRSRKYKIQDAENLASKLANRLESLLHPCYNCTESWRCDAYTNCAYAPEGENWK